MNKLSHRALTTAICSASVLSFLLQTGCASSQSSPASNSPAQQYLDFALKACDNTERQLPEITRVAEVVAQRYMDGGMIGFPWTSWGAGQGLEEDLWARSGQMMHVSWDRCWEKDRTDAEKANDVLIMGWTRDPGPKDLAQLQKFKSKKCYIVGFGPRGLPSLAEHVKLCDAWFDTGYGADDHAVKFADSFEAGHGNLLSNALNAWALMGETVAALTRHGKMPPMAQSVYREDAQKWWDKYFRKMQFHDDYQVPPVPAGKLGREYVDRIRELVRKYGRTQLPTVSQDADRIVEELGKGRKTVLAYMGHMTWAYAGKAEAEAWAIPAELEETAARYDKTTPDGALVLHLAYSGETRENEAILKKKHQRVMLIYAQNPRPEYQISNDLLSAIDMGWAFGDACVSIPGYPVRILPPSGVMQLVSFETVNVEVLARIHNGPSRN